MRGLVLGSFGLVSLLAGCSPSTTAEIGDSGMLNALAQIRAVNMLLEHGDPVFTPERGFTVQVARQHRRHHGPRAFAALADGSYRLNAHDFIAHVSPDHLQLHTADDPEGVTIQMHKWGHDGDLQRC